MDILLWVLWDEEEDARRGSRGRRGSFLKPPGGLALRAAWKIGSFFA
jgi:hypothetical protein